MEILRVLINRIYFKVWLHHLEVTMPCICGSACSCDGICVCTSQFCRCERCAPGPCRKSVLSPTKRKIVSDDTNKSPTDAKKVERGSASGFGRSTKIVLKESLSRVLHGPSQKAFRTESVIKYGGSKVSPQKRKYSPPRGGQPANTESFQSPSKKGYYSDCPIDLSTNKSNATEATVGLGSSQDAPRIQRVTNNQQPADMNKLRMNCDMKKMIELKFECGGNVTHNCRTGSVQNLPSNNSSGSAARSNYDRYPKLVERLEEPPLISSSSQEASQPLNTARTQHRLIRDTVIVPCVKQKTNEVNFRCGERAIHVCDRDYIQIVTRGSLEENAGSRVGGSISDESRVQADSMDVPGPSNPSQNFVYESLLCEEKLDEFDESDSQQSPDKRD